MIHELFDRVEAEKKEKREKDREWQKKKRERERQMYHLRHKADYDCLEVNLGGGETTEARTSWNYSQSTRGC